MKYDKEFILYLKKLGQKIKTKRECKGMSVGDLAKLSGVRAGYIKQIELGTAYGVMMEKHLSKIAKALDMKTSELSDIE